MIKKTRSVTIVIMFLTSLYSPAQITLLGDNLPHQNMNDGNFETIKGYWREAKQSPFWVTKIVDGGDNNTPIGLHNGTMFSSNTIGIIESKILNTNPEYQKLTLGDTIRWSFDADLEYKGKGSITFSLVFGTHERILKNKQPLIGSDKKFEHFSGTYTVTKEDLATVMPFVRATLYSENDIKIYLDNVNISVIASEKSAPQELQASITPQGIKLSWTETKKTYNVYRSIYRNKNYKPLISNLKTNVFVDNTIINGVVYYYLVTQNLPNESGSSPIITARKTDAESPAPPTEIKVETDDTEIRLSWKRNIDTDIKSYSVFRGDATENNFIEIAKDLKGNSYEDFSPKKGIANVYVVYAHDYSGNTSIASKTVKAKVKAIPGASFRDLILPMPIHKKLSTDTWGTNQVVPRDTSNGMEHPDWSYWGGHPIKGEDKKYHMYITRWPEKAIKGHWEWPNSTVAHVISDTPTGPYHVKEDTAYSFYQGLGHNPDITKLNDGSYMLYALINWKSYLFTSNSIDGPWEVEGTLSVDYDKTKTGDSREYQYYRNLSAVHREDGSMLIVSKFGSMMLSTHGILGPYQILGKTINYNETIPEKYRKSVYEDPTMWRDEVQYHLLINAFIDKRAIYLRSPDGIHWVFDPGVAYDTTITSYEDGTKTHWYKLERPHVLQDEYGRATHLSLAALDVPKADDLSNDNHNSKNIIIPLTVHKRIKILNKEKIHKDTKNIQILILSEEGFDAQKEVDLSSLRFGASQEVNFGRGSKVLKSKNQGKDLLVVFDGKNNGITEKNFAGKLIGKTKDDELIIGFSKLKAHQ